MYQVIFDTKALEYLEKLDRKQAERIWKKIMLAKTDPHHFFEQLAGRDDYKLRVGDYRVIADIDDSMKRIEITLIGHRKNIYKKI